MSLNAGCIRIWEGKENEKATRLKPDCPIQHFYFASSLNFLTASMASFLRKF